MRQDTLDWPVIERDLDAYGCAVAPKLISPEACRELQALYPEDARFRSRVVMAKHGFGRGEYKYFAYPLPEPIVALRRGFYSTARADRGSLERSDGRLRPLSRPSTKRSSRAAMRRARRGRRRSCCAMAPATTIACTRTCMASIFFRCRSRSCFPSQGRDFTGGEFVLTEQRPRMQSRAEVVSLRQGRRRDLRGARAPRSGDAGNLSGQSAPWGEPDQKRRALHAWRHFSRRERDASGAHAARMSVRAKSSPLNRSASPVARLSA